jgi:AcrR family transcriptional regulator
MANPPSDSNKPVDSTAHASGERRGRSRGDTTRKILGAARRLFSEAGFSGASMGAVAREAGVSKGLLHYHFDNKDHLFVETQQAFFRELHRRFSERADRGDGGVVSALEALDAAWEAIRDLHGGAAFVVETLALSNHDSALGRRVADFYDESTALLEDAITQLFAAEIDQLAVPPERMAVLIRILSEGLVIELARARTAEDLTRVERAYQDFRGLFARFVLGGRPLDEAEPLDGPMALPW